MKAAEADVTDGPKIKVNIETEAGEKKIDEEYFDALVKYLGWNRGDSYVSVQTGNELSFTFDLEGTGYSRADIKTLMVSTVAPCYRDANGELQFIKSIELGMNEVAMQRCVNEYEDESYQEFSDNKIYLNQKNTFSLDNTELYVIRTVSTESFAALLAENATKDVVIKSNNNVTFTFAKGTMQNVDGKDSYDFSTTINNTYASDMPYYVTQNNFVSRINYNYSGKLPAEASIRILAGTQYAGQTLYYSLMNEDNTFAEVQAVTVDAEGYMTVKQNHCSSYVITTEEPKLSDNTAPKEQPTAPQTGDTSNAGIYLAIAVIAGGMLLSVKKTRRA